MSGSRPLSRGDCVHIESIDDEYDAVVLHVGPPLVVLRPYGNCDCCGCTSSIEAELGGDASVSRIDDIPNAMCCLTDPRFGGLSA